MDISQSSTKLRRLPENLNLPNLGRIRQTFHIFLERMAAHEEGQIFSKHAWRSRAWGYKHFLITSYPHRALTEYFRGKKKKSVTFTPIFPIAQRQPDAFCPSCPSRLQTKRPGLKLVLGAFEPCECSKNTTAGALFYTWKAIPHFTSHPLQ